MRITVSIMISFLLAFVVSFNSYGQSRKQQFDPSETTQKLAAALFYIENFYLDSVYTPKIVEDAIVSMLKDLDPHSAYISKDDIDEANEPLEGSFEGIGITFQLFNDTILVIAPVPGGPSDKLGILAGDKIIRIDGKDAFGDKINNRYVMDRLRGKKGTTVDVSIYRKGQPELIDYAIVRDKIPLHSIDASFMIEDDIGYIKLNRFSRTTLSEFRESMTDLKKDGMKSLILDLRGNSGGYLGTAVELADEFLPDRKLIVYTEGLNSERQDFTSRRKGSFEEGKLIVMINEGSASASEIVAGAVQDWDRGIVLGRRSFGKGLVQRPFQLPDGSVIRLTAAEYYTPTGRSIQRPYDNGVEDYYKDMQKRIAKGELVHADSIQFPDSLMYYTAGNRVVYGGGGIMPDYFVGWDSTQVSSYYSDLVRKGVLNSFVLDYVNNNRRSLKRTYRTVERFKDEFVIDESFMKTFLERADDEGVEFDEVGFAASEKYLRYQIKGLIARNIWEMGDYFKIIAGVDDALQAALRLLREDESYTLMLSGLKD